MPGTHNVFSRVPFTRPRSPGILTARVLMSLNLLRTRLSYETAVSLTHCPFHTRHSFNLGKCPECEAARPSSRGHDRRSSRGHGGPSAGSRNFGPDRKITGNAARPEDSCGRLRQREKTLQAGRSRRAHQGPADVARL